MQKILFYITLCLWIISASAFAENISQTNVSTSNLSNVSMANVSAPVAVAPTANESYIDLASRVTIIETNIQAIKTQVTDLQQQVLLSEEGIKLLKQEQDQSFSAWVISKVGQHYLIIFIAAICIILLILIFLHTAIWRSNKTKSQLAQKPGHKIEEDFDLMSTAEGMPAKLHLAHAYIDMGNNEMATSLLQEIIAQGEGNIKEEAQQLLTKIQTK
jgi:FimV-like protein